MTRFTNPRRVLCLKKICNDEIDFILFASSGSEAYEPIFSAIENGINVSKPRRQSRQAKQSKESSAADLVSTKTTTVDAAQGPKIWTEREISAMSLDEFDTYEDEINQAITEGRVMKS